MTFHPRSIIIRNKRAFTKYLLGLSILLLLTMLTNVPPVSAVVGIIVNTTVDEDGTGTNCSLREAITSANTNADYGGCTGAVGSPFFITVPTGTYTLLTAKAASSDDALQIGPGGSINVTINGAGSGTTIITTDAATCATGTVRVLNLDPNLNGDVDVQISGVTISNGIANTYGGGAILGGGTGNSFTLSDSVISNNCTAGVNSAAGISWSPDGDVTITDSTFSNNLSGQAAGALLFDSSGTLDITGSLFSGNTAAITGSAGGALFLGTGTFDVNGNIFTNNQATDAGGIGGAIYLGSGTLNLGTSAANVLVGNTAGVSTSSGLGVRGGTATAENNSWGCNDDPGSGSGCDLADNDGGTLDADPWLVLSNSASPTSINNGSDSTLTADFLHNSDAGTLTATFVAALVGRTITWSNAQFGSLSNEQTTIQAAGTATATFTGTSCGAGGADAAVDNSGAVTASVTVTGCTAQTGPNFVVNTADDHDDTVCSTSDCTLREAINAANALGGADTITFDIPDTGADCSSNNVCTIALGSSLPNVTDDVTIDGAPNNGDITVSGSDSVRILQLINNKTLNLNALTIADGFASSSGAGLYVNGGATLNVSNSTFSGNSISTSILQSGGAAILNAAGTVRVTNSTFVDNSFTVPVNCGPCGGTAILNLFGTLQVTNSTFSGNIFTSPDACNPSCGGAIRTSGGTTTVTNSTFSGNLVSGNGHAGALSVDNGTVTLRNSIVSGSTPVDCYISGGTFTADAYNIDSDGSCGNATQKTVGTIALAALANNGGSTQTMALANSSAAIDAGDNSVCDDNPGPNDLDQRGEDRDDLNCDAGAFEFVLTDGDAVSKHNLSFGPLYTFGPTLAGVTSGAIFSPTLTIERDLTPPGNIPPANALPITWDATVTGGTYNFIFMLCYDPAVLTGQNENNLHVFHYSGSAWIDLGGTLNNTTHLPYHCVTADNAVSSLSPLALAPLRTTAVNVTGVQGRVNPKGKVVVKWKTTTESQIAGFNVFRKNGQGAWKQINANFKQAKHAGDAAGGKYRFTNRDMKAIKTYRYKIQVVYLDGHTEWTNTVKVQTP